MIDALTKYVGPEVAFPRGASEKHLINNIAVDVLAEHVIQFFADGQKHGADVF